MRAVGAIFVLTSSMIAAGPVHAGQCDVVDYAGWREVPNQSWDFRWPLNAATPRLTMIGSEHSRDPAHPQFSRIAASFRAAKPSVTFFEGPDRGVRADSETTIREAGESGYVRYLAKEAGLPARSLEPSPAGQLKSLSTSFSVDQVWLFFALREAARLRDREGKTGALLDEAVAAMLKKAAGLAPAGAMPFSDIASLTKAASRYWPNRDWRTLPQDWFSPLADDAKTGGVFLGAINRADSNNRNRHMVALLTAAVKSGERPFVVVGRNHVPMQAPALRCELDAQR